MKIKAYIYTIAAAVIMGGYFSLLPYNYALAQTSDKSPAEKSQKSEKSTGTSAGGGSQSSMHEGGHTGTPAKGGKAMGSHRMVGTVEDIDMQKGIVDLKTAEGDLKLHFPPKAVSSIKKGDQIQVQLSFSTVNKQ